MMQTNRSRFPLLIAATLAALVLLLSMTVLPGCPKKTSGPSEEPVATGPGPAEGPQAQAPETAEAKSGQVEEQKTGAAGSEAPGEAKDVSAVTIEFADGSTKTIGDYKGKVVLLDFWATYCKPCIKKLPHLEEMQKRYGEDKLVVIAVTLDPDVQTAVGWAKANDMNLPIAKFTDELKQAFFAGEDTFAIPQARLIDADGKLVKSWGPEGTAEDIESAVKELLGEASQ